MPVVSVRSALVVLALFCASIARAESDGVPFIDGNWTGKIKATYYDPTNEGSNRRKQKYKDRVDVVIDQGVGDFNFDITFQEGLPVSGSVAVTTVELEGFVGNGHLSIAQPDPETVPLLVGSGRINNKARKMKIKGVAATEDYTIEFEIQLKKQNT